MTLEPLHELSTASLRTLAASLRSGSLAAGISRRAVQQFAGAANADVLDCLQKLVEGGMQPGQIAVGVEAIADARDRASDPARLFDLVMSGPDVAGYPTGDTAATMQSLVARAQREILLVGYAVHNGRQLFEPIAQRMKAVQGLRVRFCLDIPRKPNDTSLASEIVRRYVEEFRKRHWPWEQLPELFYDPRSLTPTEHGRSSLHAKCVVVDRQAALVTSANFTEAAQQRNIEVGIVVRYGPLVERLAGYMYGLCDNGTLAQYALS